METTIFIDNVRVVGALLRRDFILVWRTLKDSIINAAIIVGFYQFVYGVLGPLVGFSMSAAADVFIGNFVITLMMVSYNNALRDLFDLRVTHFFNYRLTLPLSFGALMCQYIMSYMMIYTATTVPILILGKLIWGSYLDTTQANWFMFVCIYISAQLFLALFYLCWAFGANMQFFLSDFFQRVYAPLFLLGCTFYRWKNVYAASPWLAWLLLLNPLTYINEGMRSALFDRDAYISGWLCCSVILGLASIAALLLFIGIKRRLDVV